MPRDIKRFSTIFLLKEILRKTKKEFNRAEIPIGCIRCVEDVPASHYRSDYGDMCYACAEANNSEHLPKALKYPWADEIIELHKRGFYL